MASPIRSAADADTRAIVALLTEGGMRTEDIGAPGVHFWVAEKAGAHAGCIGLELPPVANGCALLRSAYVRPAARGAHLGEQLLAALIAFARTRTVNWLYCFSDGAGPYWRARGWVECPVPELLGVLGDAPQSLLFDRLGWLPTEIAWRFVIADDIRAA